MKGIVRVVDWLPENMGGFTAFPFIFIADESLKKHEVMMNHERIHLRQQL